MLVASDDGVNPGDEFAGIYVRLLIFLSYLRFQGLPFLKIQVINLVELTVRLLTMLHALLIRLCVQCFMGGQIDATC
jgi:hypothetical protein